VAEAEADADADSLPVTEADWLADGSAEPEADGTREVRDPEASTDPVADGRLDSEADPEPVALGTGDAVTEAEGTALGSTEPVADGVADSSQSDDVAEGATEVAVGSTYSVTQTTFVEVRGTTTVVVVVMGTPRSSSMTLP
jgi:hypothetical protein